MTDQQLEAALACSFLAGLPPEVARALQAEGELADYLAGTTVYRPGSPPQAALVVGGLMRVYLTSPEGRQGTVRYARPGDVCCPPMTPRLPAGLTLAGSAALASAGRGLAGWRSASIPPRDHG